MREKQGASALVTGRPAPGCPMTGGRRAYADGGAAPVRARTVRGAATEKLNGASISGLLIRQRNSLDTSGQWFCVKRDTTARVDCQRCTNPATNIHRKQTMCMVAIRTSLNIEERA
ncbi:hypothetical protein GCM10009647_044550 [Streptomyces sanglieri]